jgi:hypothetical protein
MLLILEPLPNVRVPGVDRDSISGSIGGAEKRKPHDVIPVGVANEDIDGTLALTKRSLHEIEPELSDTGAGIENDLGALPPDFHARRVTSGGSPPEIGETANIGVHRLLVAKVDTLSSPDRSEDLLLDLPGPNRGRQRAPHPPKFHSHEEPRRSVDQIGGI